MEFLIKQKFAFECKPVLKISAQILPKPENLQLPQFSRFMIVFPITVVWTFVILKFHEILKNSTERICPYVNEERITNTKMNFKKKGHFYTQPEDDIQNDIHPRVTTNEHVPYDHEAENYIRVRETRITFIRHFARFILPLSVM